MHCYLDRNWVMNYQFNYNSLEAEDMVCDTNFIVI